MENHADDKNQRNSSPKPLGQILKAFPSHPNLESISTPNAENSSITISQKEKQEPIGKHLSEHGLKTLRDLALNVSKGRPMDDEMCKTLLAQHFGPSRFASNVRLKHIYGGEGGYDCQISEVDISLDALHDSEMKLYDALEYLNRPAPYEFVARQLAALRVVMARRGEAKDDLTLLIDTYANHLAEFPPDVVKFICDKIIDDAKWFPLISEMRSQMLAMVQWRRAVWNCFQEKRDPALAARAEAKRIAGDPRLGIHWKVLARNQWMDQHYEWWIGEAEKMVDLAAQNPGFMDLAGWNAEVERRKAERREAAAARSSSVAASGGIGAEKEKTAPASS